MITFHERLKSERLAKGLSQEKFGRIGGVGKQAQIKYEKGERFPDAAYLMALDKAGCDVSYIITGNRKESLGKPEKKTFFRRMNAGENVFSIASEENMAESLNDSKSASARRFDKDEFAQVPMYDVAASAGHGALVEDEAIEGMLVFRNDWIRNELRVNPSELYLVTVNGDSMYPTLSPNDIILVHDTSHTGSVPCDGIYLLRLDGSLLVKRLQRRPSNRVKIISDNPSYEAYEVDADDLTDADFCVLGRVVWSGRKM